MLSPVLLSVTGAALLFEFVNGFHDTANAVATSVYTKALGPGEAVLLASVMNFLGALSSEKVARTIAQGLVDVELEQYVILAALLAAMAWNLFTWSRGIPSSSSHALIGGLLGAAAGYAATLEHILWGGVAGKVLLPLLLSPAAGFWAGFLLTALLCRLLRDWPRGRANRAFLRLQLLSAALAAYSHGNNDAQKTMGIIALALTAAGITEAEEGIPLWVKAACAAALAAGTALGGRKIMRTMGRDVTRLRPVNGFAAQTAAALVIESATFLGAPVSTTQVMAASIMGTGCAGGFRRVKWSLAEDLGVTWVLTLPAAAALGWGSVKLLGLFVQG
ncbi:MAG: anion permease [Bacillota bacterium]|nr:anion permease [Bacillota bacterium]